MFQNLNKTVYGIFKKIYLCVCIPVWKYWIHKHVGAYDNILIVI